MATNQENLELTDRFFRAIETGDVDALGRIYSPGALVWHNNDNRAQTVGENLVVLKWVVENIKGLKYSEVRRQPTPTGFVQQHVLRGTFRGKEVNLPACIVGTIENGHITRIDEYLDSAHTAIFRG